MSEQGMRKAAALLASMHPRDRAWVRRQLPDAQWPALNRLLNELSGFGEVNLNHDAVSQALQEVDSVMVSPEPPTPDVLLAGLDGLGPVWAARTLAACAPDHLDLYAATQTDSQASALREAADVSPKTIPPRLAQAMTRIVRERGRLRLLESKAS